jgi:hypothetical protein
MHFLDGGNSGKRMYVGLFMNPTANNKELAFVFFSLFSFFQNIIKSIMYTPYMTF